MRFSSFALSLTIGTVASATCLAQSFAASGHGGHGHGGHSGGNIFGPSGLGNGGGNIFGPSGLGNAGGGSIGFGGGRSGFGGVGYGYGLGAVGYGGYGIGYPYFGTPYLGGTGLPPIFPNAIPTNFGNGFGGGGFGGMMLPTPPARLASATNPSRRPNPARAKEYVEIGDRSFRGGNIHRAEERYRLAIKADPTSPIAHVHLAQVSLVRGDYAATADQIRSAVTVSQGSGWLVNAPDVQAMFAEPGDYARHIAKLESHLQTHPNDRDGWFVLGAQHYFSGRTQASNDAFARLTDRRPDEALAAFLGVAKP